MLPNQPDNDTVRNMPVNNYPIDHSFNVKLANKLSGLETFNKHLYRPNTYLHKWWARRCGTTFRLILKHLVQEDAKQDFYSAGGLEGRVILDPMIGGGTTLHEAIRLGANVVGFDIDPIPVLQAKASMSMTPLPGLEVAFNELYSNLRQSLSELNNTACPSCKRYVQFRFILYGVKRHCKCGEVTIVDSLNLSHLKDGTIIGICPRCRTVRTCADECQCQIDPGFSPLIEKGKNTCPRCKTTYQDDITVPFYARYEPITTVGVCPAHGQFFSTISDYDRKLLEAANKQRKSLHFEDSTIDRVGRKSVSLIQREITDFRDLFSSRQLLYLHQAIHFVNQYKPPIRYFLALIVSTSLEFNSLLCGYKGSSQRRAGAVRHVFSHHAYSFPYTAVENNPIYPAKSSGTLLRLFHDRLHRGRIWAAAPRERSITNSKHKFLAIQGEKDGGMEVSDVLDLFSGQSRFLVRQQSSTELPLADGTVDFVVTDPPYFDNVHYSDLSAYFRVWLKQMLPQEDFPAFDWCYDVQKSAVSSDKEEKNEDLELRFIDVMSQVFSECHRVLKKESGRMIFSYHHARASAWSSLAKALVKARFNLINRYVVHSEHPISVHINNLKSLTHDAIFVFSPVESNIRANWERPLNIAVDDSYSFCLDCATLIGWILNQNSDRLDIDALWSSMLP